jgi:hypothetical protein
MQGFGFFKSHLLNTLHDDEPGVDGDGSPTPETNEPAKTPEKLSMTQEELDKMIGKRIAQSQKKWQKDLEDQKTQESLTETEKLKAAKEAAETKATQRETIANGRLIKADLRSEAVSQGVPKEKLERFLKIVETEGLEVDGAGATDAAEIKKAIEAALKDMPEFMATQAGDLGSGSNRDLKGDAPITLQGAIAAKFRK